MAIIYNYPLNSILLAEDMLIGTSTNIVNGQPKNATKNFSIADLTGFIKQNVSLNDVLLVGNTSLLDAKVGGLYLYDTPVAGYGNIVLNQNRFSFNTVTHGEVFRAQRDMFSSFSSSGYRGSFEVSSITANRVWDFPNKSGTVALLSDVPVGTTPTLQEVTDTGAITTDTITVGGITSGNLYSDGYNFGISDNYDTNYNMLYQPFVGLQITNNSDYVYLYQDASIGFQTVAGDGNLRSDLLTSTRSWQFPDASGTLALLSNIPIIPTVGTWGALNYPTWTTGTPFVKMTAVGTFALDTTTYYPYPTGTISQYIRGDGTFATFPSMTIPTLQQVTTAGNTTTDAIFLQNGVSPLSVILSNSYISLADTSTGKQISISTNNDIGFIGAGGSSLYLKSPATITGTNTQTLQNATGTIALLSDIPSGGVTSVGLTMPSAFTVTNSPITSSGDIAVTGAGLVSQYVRGDGTLANFPASTGGGASVSYYLNGSVSQGTIGGVAYKEMNGVPVIGAGTDFTINANGYIAQFITDAGDPNKLLIPAGNWNFEAYFSASSGGGSPKFYIELYKYDGTTFTLIASNSATPEGITNGTSIDLYFTALAVPSTVLLATDRLAVRFYVIHSGRTITMHTENSHLSQIITTFTTGLTALNGLTDQVQYFNVGTGATNFNISSSSNTHTFNLLFNIRRNANNSSNNNINYNGYAVTGSAESSAVWTITRLTISGSGAITVGTATNVAWTNRESVIYI